MEQSDRPAAQRAFKVGRVLAVVAVVGGLVAVRWATRGYDTPEQAVVALRSVAGQPWAMVAYAGLYLVLTTAFFPAVLLHVAAGATWGFSTAAVLNVVVFNLAASAQFLAARRLGRDRVAHWVQRYGLLRLDAGAQSHGVRATLAIRALPLPTMLVNLSAGVSAIRWRDFAVGTFLGAMPYLLIYTYFASAIAQGVAGAQERALVQGLIAALLLVLISVLPRLIGGRLRRAAGLGAEKR